MFALLRRQDGSGVEFPLGDTVTIGRSLDSTIVLTGEQASRNHAMIRSMGNRATYYLFDLGSRNGSFVNGHRISAPTGLKDGTMITLGGEEMLFCQEIDETSSIIAGSANDPLCATVTGNLAVVLPITLLVADIRNFSSISEAVPIATMSRLMAQWYHEVQTTVLGEKGILDKFSGDCVMAYWHSSDRPEALIRQCLKAAYQIYWLTANLNRFYPELEVPMHVGVGINSGVAALGVGIDNTALGDTVNLAFHLESASKDLNCDVVLSKSSYIQLPEYVWERKEQSIIVKGRQRPVQVCGLTFDEVRALNDDSVVT